MIPEHISTVLIDGERSKLEGILFQVAIQYAEVGLNTWFISPEPFNQLPTDLTPPDKECLKLITFLYLKDQKELVARLNEIHLWHKWPQLIIVNGYEHYCTMLCPEYVVSGAAFVTASLLGATATCAGRHSSEKACLLVSCNLVSCGRSKQLKMLTDMYFSNVILVDNSNKDDNEVVLQIKNCFDSKVS